MSYFKEKKEKKKEKLPVILILSITLQQSLSGGIVLTNEKQILQHGKTIKTKAPVPSKKASSKFTTVLVTLPHIEN